MKDKGRKILITILGILINIAGRTIADTLQWPIWLDMVGTFTASYYAGLWGGIVAGVSNNLYAGFFLNIDHLVYSVTSVITAVVIHIFVKRGYMDSLLKAVVSTYWLGIICTVVSTPLNLFFYNGYSGNVWGDTLVDMLRWYNVGNVLSSVAGEAVVEIIDKQVCVIATFLLICIVRYFRLRKGKAAKAAALLLTISLACVSVLQPIASSAAEGSAASDSAQNHMVANVYNNTNGMVSSEANTICETDDGYIWIGSYAGLSRYDGQEFEFIREGGLVNVTAMMKDSQGRLWIGTNDAGVARYENGSYTYFRMEDGLPSDSIRSFTEDEDGTVYVGTTDKICKISTEDTVEVLDLDVSFAKYLEYYQGKLAVLDNAGKLSVIDDQGVQTLGGSYGEYFCYCMAVTSKGLMVGTDTGELFVMDDFDGGLFVKEDLDIDASRICTLFEDSKGRIWIALDSGFAYMEQDGTYYDMYYEEFPSSIDFFHEDYQGNLWLASSNYGVMKLSESPFSNLFDSAGLDGKVVNAVTFYDGDYYCGTDDGLVILDGTTYRSKTNAITQETEGCRVRSLFVDAKEQIWVCTYSGLWRYAAGGGIRKYTVETDGTTTDRFRCMAQLSDGSVVAGTADGINYIENGEVTRTLTAEDGLANTQILSIVEGADGNVWAGSDGSGIYVISEEGLVKNYTVEDGLSSNIILRIVPVEKGYLLVTSNALCYMDASGSVRRLSSFPYFNNFDILLEGDTAYVTCSSGLYAVDLAELIADDIGQAILYNADQGLLSGLTANSWNYQDGNGNMLLCSNSGVVVFEEENIGSQIDMKFGISSVEAEDEEVAADGTAYVLPRNAKNITITASVRNYAFTDVKVKFYIKELDDNPDIYEWDEVQPIQLLKTDFTSYHICLQILDSTGSTVLQEQQYLLEKEMHTWEESDYKIYLWVVGTEIFLFTIISIVAMILFVIRKNELEKNKVELESRVREQTQELSHQQEKIEDIFTRTVTALSEAVDAKDRYTSGHSRRVAEYARKIAERLGKSEEEQEDIYRAGLLHDIGKIRIPAEIINKPGRLTEEEYNTIKIHPVTGYHILQGISEDATIATGAKYHHERYDGNGYPNGLSGEKIPEIARILAVADAYDAMASNRSYRNALPQDKVRSEIANGRGTQFDPVVADAMLAMIDEDTEYTMRQQEETEKYILSVDDEEMNNKIIEHIMRDEPLYTVVTAKSGREALDKMKLRKYDLVLLDIKMPDMDGFETLRRIREDYDTPVIFMTSDRSFGASKEFETCGCNDYITKPILPILMKEIIHNVTECHVDHGIS